MKKILILMVFLAIELGLFMPAHADLNLLGQGTSTYGTYNLIYDTDLDVTWYDYTNGSGPNGDTWQTQMDWASALSVTFGSNTYTDWRLPSTDISCTGYDCADSEMAHLYYTELGNVSWPMGCSDDSPWCLTNTGDFQNLQPYNYWSDSDYFEDPNSAAYFMASEGFQAIGDKSGSHYAIAVRGGMASVVVVPEPISSALFLIGGATLGFRRMRKKRVSG